MIGRVLLKTKICGLEIFWIWTFAHLMSKDPVFVFSEWHFDVLIKGLMPDDYDDDDDQDDYDENSFWHHLTNHLMLLSHLNLGQVSPGNRSPMRPRKSGTSSKTNFGRFMSLRALMRTTSCCVVWWHHVSGITLMTGARLQYLLVITPMMWCHRIISKTLFITRLLLYHYNIIITR